MKTNPVLKNAMLLGSVGAALLATSAQAQFNPARGNMVWAARDVNGAARGAFDIVVDLGSYTRFTSGTDALLLGGSSLSESYQGVGPAVTSESRFANSDVLATFDNLDNIFSSAFGVDPTGQPVENRNWLLTKARTDVDVQSTPWIRNSTFSQGGTGNKMDGVRTTAIGSGADFNNTSTKDDAAVGSAYGNSSVSPFTGYTASEVSTGDGFAGAAFKRMDLYNVPADLVAPYNSPGDYLGYFEYQADGDLWFIPANFVPVPEASTYGLFAGAGLLFMALRRQLAAKTS